jgi:class 3 adenylate cyclase/tetratricopeptide (TPR) repeat protein
MAACPFCGSENAATARFCAQCGGQLGVPPASRREERKVVSVVFVDLVGSTASAEASDPEDVRATLRVYHEHARRELESFGGTVEKFIGDAVVAVFGAPLAHEDDAERAVRAALAVREAVERLNDDESGRDLHVRIAVNTGEALVALDAVSSEGEAMVAGDVMNTAARLQSEAPVDGILVGAATRNATQRAIVYRDAGPVQAKGKSQPVVAFEAVEARSRLGVDLGGAGRAPLVGRDGELQLLIDALERARTERITQLATLMGVPGIGKSRLVYELAMVVDSDDELITWRQGRSLPYGEGVSFWALGEIVKAHAGILESDSREATLAKLGEAVATLDDESERAWVERHLRPLVGLSSDDVTTADRRGEAYSAWRRFLESIAERGPAVLVFEDLHWADDGLLDFVDGLVDWVDRVPLLVVCTGRPELLDRRPEWGARKPGPGVVSVSPLDADTTAQLLHTLLDRPLLDAQTRQELVERTAGNPLYAEEFVRMFEEGGVLEELPATVQGIVSARIDLLPPDEKELLQDAAVLGKVFWSDALAVLGSTDPWQLTGVLRSLERKEFIRREHRSAVAGATQHAFVHALVRDTVYGQLPRASRARRHLAAATWIESLPDDRAEDRAETLAHHYLTALELYRAAGEDVSPLAPRAVRAFQEAGERALGLSAFRTADRFLSLALELVPNGEEPSAELLLAAGQAMGFVGRDGDELTRASDAFERAGDLDRAAECAVVASWHLWHVRAGEAMSWLERAASLVEARPPSRAKALVLAEQARREMLNYNRGPALRLASEAVSMAEALGEDEIRADALVTGGVVTATGGDRNGIEMIESALDLVGHRGKVASRGYTNLFVAYATLGEPENALASLERGLERAEREGDEQGAWFIRGNLIGLLFSSGDWDRALLLIRRFLDEVQESYMLSAAKDVLARILDARGDAPAALDQMRSAVALARELDEPQTLWPSLIGLASLARRHGLGSECEAALSEVMTDISASEDVGDPQEWHVELALVLDDLGRHAQARALAERVAPGPWADVCRAALERRYVGAAETLASVGDEPLQAQLRLLAARQLAAESRHEEAAAQLERARVFWLSVDATAYLREADDVLAAAS